MMDGMMGLGWLWVILVCIALMLLLAVLIAAIPADRGLADLSAA